jgi:mono/diheme cytochrome c family protein
VSYAVTYPQFVDPDATIMRHVRLPYGQAITFDKTSQQFTIPGGSRFYKTILQRVVNSDGQNRWRKVETQLIVSWPNLTNTTGAAAVSALFGTYAWNDNESQATLVTDPYRDGSAFRDRIVTYVSDEQKAAIALAGNSGNTVYSLRNARALRSYAIPGSRRCMQCHAGSPTKTFVLGFQPLQVARRKLGEGGVIDPAGDDELSQLQRFVDYGLITGISSADDIVPLENSEGARSPRNNNELVAQGYLLGNCAHCHNPGGDPSLENPSLKDILNFQPSATGGVFQFPIDRTSPRIFRAGGTASPIVPMPYITPSVLDIGPLSSDTWDFLAPKCSYVGPTNSTGRNLPPEWYPIMAPWRGLLYRGVDTPFTYSDDLALVPHMPMNTQSFDCRAPRIVGDWMVSIPAVSTSADGSEYGLYQYDNVCAAMDSSVQPYREIKHGQLGFTSATDAADARLDKYHNAPVGPFLSYIAPTNEDLNPVEPPAPSRYNFCPDTYDIFDPLVLQDPTKQPVPGDTRIMNGAQLIMPPDGVPDHAHWVVYDPTLVPGNWAPRRPDWYQVLVSQIVPLPSGANQTLAAAQQAAEQKVVGVLQSVTISPAAANLSQTLVPMGLWQANASCDFSGVGKVSDYTTSSSGTTQYQAAWMQKMANANQLHASDPVYAATPGEAIHDMICANCHGAKGDSSGRQATILSEMTGGNANVTDLVHGINVPGNRNAVFSSAPMGSAKVDDWAARYFSWMGMGGTKQTIPSSILTIVANTTVLGVQRPTAAPPKDANMLSNAYTLCGFLLPSRSLGSSGDFQGSSFTVLSDTNMFNFEGGMFESDTYEPTKTKTNFIFSNGDVLLWEQVCSVDNPPPVRAVTVSNWMSLPIQLTVGSTDFYDPSLYPVGNQVVDHRGNVVTGISTSNYFPWCVRKPGDAASQAGADSWLSSNPSSNGQVLPYCPVTDRNGAPYISAGSGWVNGDTHLSYDAVNQWAIRGAINAGVQVFEYLNMLASGDLIPTPSYDQCEQLSASN